MEAAKASKRFLDGLCVLVVEDEAIISFLLEDMLGELGAADVRHAGNLKTALAFLDTHKPDLAVLDVNLGGERVYPVAEKLEGQGVAFLFTTGYGKSGLDPRWSAKPVVQKPFNIEVMTAALRALLAK
jgi:DNA-binding response OmpR family regulator